MIPERHWRGEHLVQLALGVLIAICSGVFIAQGITALLPGADTAKEQSGVLGQVAGTLVIHAVALGMVHWFLRCHGTGWREAFGLDAPGKGRALRLTLFFSLAILPVALALAKLSEMALQAAGIPTDTQSSVRVLQATQTLAQRAGFALTALITAPVVEEILFRGVLYPALKKMGRPSLALWGSAIIFAIIHFNPPTLIPLTVLAVGLTLLYETTGNLLAPILAHALFNTANFLWLISSLPR